MNAALKFPFPPIAIKKRVAQMEKIMQIFRIGVYGVYGVGPQQVVDIKIITCLFWLQKGWIGVLDWCWIGVGPGELLEL